MKTCSHCGSSLKENVPFCGKCGANQMGAPPEKEKKPKRRRGLVFAVTILGVLLLAGGLVTGQLLWDMLEPGGPIPAYRDSFEEVESKENMDEPDEEKAEASLSKDDEPAASSTSKEDQQSSDLQAQQPVEGDGNSFPPHSNSFDEQAAVAISSQTHRVETAIQPQWDKASAFDNLGMARVKLGDYWGLIDRSGAYVVRPQYSSLNYFFQGLAVVDLDGTFGFIGTDGEVAIALAWDNAFSFSEDLAAVSHNGKWGYILQDGSIQIPLEYDAAHSFSEGYACVSVGSDVFFIDIYGRKVSDNYQAADNFSEGLAAVKTGGKWGFVDTNFNFVIPATYDMAYPFAHGRGAVDLNGKQFFIDGQNNRCAARPDEVWNFSEGLATARVGQKYGYVDHATGDFALEPQYDDVLGFAYGVAPVRTGSDDWYYIDRTGKTVISGNFQDAKRFYEGLAVVKTGGRCGMINHDGELVVQAQWEDIDFFSNGMVAVQATDGKWGYVSVLPETGA